MSPRYIYCWHEPRLNAIKVGVGLNPRWRMEQYAEKYGLTYDARSLRAVKIPPRLHHEITETKCHEALCASGCFQVFEPHPNGFGSSQELFKLGAVTYYDAMGIVAKTIFPPTDPMSFDEIPF
jgi:hypothetical protein